MLKVISTTYYRDVVVQLILLERPGDELPLHDHDFEHITLTAGRLELFDETGKKMRLERNAVVFPAGVKHGIRALSPNSMFINVSPRGAVTHL